MSDWGSRAWQMVKETRFVAHNPEELWAMVEPADGATATELGELLTQAAKTIKEIGGDLRTHSMAVEWDGEGGEAFRTWCNQAALATLGLGDYSESAGKWLGHAADTLHEVKPQLEILRTQSATARSVLDAHAAKATDVGNHDGGPSATEVKTAKTRYTNDSADAAGLMIKLAQSYTASTEQIDALETPEFPKLPERFVPEARGETAVSVPTGQKSVTPVETSGRRTAVDSGMSGTSSAPQVSAPHHSASVAHVPDTAPRGHTHPTNTTIPTNTAIDSVGTLPSTPSVPAAGAAPLPGVSGPDGRTSSPTGVLPPAFGGTATLAPGTGAGGGRPAYGARSSLRTPSEPGASGSSRVPGRGLPTSSVPGMSGAGTATPRMSGRGLPGPASARGNNGITGGRPISPAGRSTGAIPRGTVVGGTPNEQQPPMGRGGVAGGTSEGATPAPRSGERVPGREGAARGGPRSPAQSGGIIGGQPKQAPQRRRALFTSGGEGLVRGANAHADGTLPQGGGTTRGGSAAPLGRAGRSPRGERTRDRSEDHADDGSNRHQGDQRVIPPTTD
ncbi:hypothetical protein OG194_25565 [Streptomyces sp. NBC_01288]|uniref:hypothetical protein n=1 Tax=Streptomyces sp. NBC_01288 TaxID=2903814 RepID=UPI002E0F6B21|nr:hypothetical protein OG194_25565 [Streptomyces sp. NBC_01288]